MECGNTKRRMEEDSFYRCREEHREFLYTLSNAASILTYYLAANKGQAIQSVTEGEGGLKPVDTGDLKVIKTKTPELANSEWPTNGYDKPPYHSDFEVKVVEAGNEEYVRVFSYNADGTSNKLGGQQFDTMGKFIDEDAFVNERLIGD